jgi:hypothetical protein
VNILFGGIDYHTTRLADVTLGLGGPCFAIGKGAAKSRARA